MGQVVAHTSKGRWLIIKPSPPKRGRGRLPEVLVYERFNYKALTGEILVFWIADRLREAIAHECSPACSE